MWRRPLNSVTLATATHRRSKKVHDGMGTQVKAQMVNKCRIKMIWKELYNVKKSFIEKGRKTKKDCRHEELNLYLN